MKTLPVAIIAAALAMFLGQFWKVIRPVFRGSRPKLSEFLRSGGMPSAHTAATASMALVAGLREGFDSTSFALGFVLSAVVAHDAVRVRGALNTIINILKRTTEPELLAEQGGLPETVGHTVAEVAVGFALAAGVAAVCHILLP